MNDENVTCMMTRDAIEYEVTGAAIDEETHGAIVIRKPYKITKAWCGNCGMRLDSSDYMYCPFCGKKFSMKSKVVSSWDI